MADALPAHSKIGASSHYRWSSCPGSVRLCSGIEGQESDYAKLGTAAHKLAELCFEKKQQKAGFYFGLKIREGLGVDLDGIVDEDMIEAVQLYLDYVRSIKMDWDAGDKMMIEHKFDLSKLYPGLFGTSDVIKYLAKTKHMYVIDYKHGAGIPVEIKNKKGNPNTQLTYYGVGALMSTGLPVEKITIVIVQPRCNHPDGPIRSLDVDPMELLDFAADLVDEAKATEAPDAPLWAGDHCRFCPAAAICPEVGNKAMRAAQEEFADLPVVADHPKAQYPYSVEQLAKALVYVPILKAWCEQVNKFAYAQAAHGVKIPGFKLVNKRAIRKWKDEAKATETLSLYLPAELMYHPRELKSPAQIEDQLTRDEQPVLKDLVSKESSGTTLVPETDSRPAVAVADASTEFELDDLLS